MPDKSTYYIIYCKDTNTLIPFNGKDRYFGDKTEGLTHLSALSQLYPCVYQLLATQVVAEARMP